MSFRCRHTRYPPVYPKTPTAKPRTFRLSLPTFRVERLMRMVTPLQEATKTVRERASKWHGAQMYGDQPYLTHLDEVVDILAEFGFTDEATQAAGYLHDVLEDTQIGIQGLQKAGVPQTVIQAVQFCTDEPGHNRRTRKEQTYKRVRMTLNELAFDSPTGWLLIGLRVKMADRLANIRASIRQGSSLLEMYRKEAGAFRVAYFDFEACPRMWAEYDRLLGVRHG